MSKTHRPAPTSGAPTSEDSSDPREPEQFAGPQQPEEPEEPEEPEGLRVPETSEDAGSAPEDTGSEGGGAPAESPAAPERLRRAKAALVFDDPLYGRSRDDSDGGWGERPVPRGGSAADLARFLDEKPPHHI